MRRINTAAWSTFLRRLDEYAQRSGTAAVPELHVEPDGYPLGRRAAYWRRQRDLLAPSDRHELDVRPGWYWAVSEVRWQARLRRLRDIAKHHTGGRLRRADYLFVTRLRERFTELEPADQALVTQLVGGPRTSAPHAFAAAVRTYLSRNPGADAGSISRRETIVIDGKRISLGRQAHYVRERFWSTDPPGQKLSEEEICDIESLPGWQWRPRRSGT